MWKKLIPKFIKNQIKKRLSARTEEKENLKYVKIFEVGDQFIVKNASSGWNGKIYNITSVSCKIFTGYRLSDDNDPRLPNFMGKIEHPYRINKELNYDNIDFEKSEVLLWNKKII